jgi:hypothetical protein
MITAKKVSTETKIKGAIDDKMLKERVTTVSIYKPRLHGDNKLHVYETLTFLEQKSWVKMKCG